MGRPQLLEEWIDGATICRESSAVGFVWSLYEGCLQFFAKLVPLVSEESSAKSAKAILNEEIGRLISWGTGFEDGELDRALERDSELKNTTVEYLSNLGALLVDKLLVSGFLDLKQRSELEVEADELRSLVHNAKNMIDEYEDDESDLESESEARSSIKKAMLDEVVSDINFYVLRLMDLLPSIERTALQPNDAAEPKKDPNSIPSVPFQVSKPAHAYVLQVRDKFPLAESKLIERLGQANWERRKRLCEDKTEILEKATSELAKSVFVPQSMFHDSGIGSSIPALSAYAHSAVSHSSFRTSDTESQLGSYRVPPTPREVHNGEPFTCEICGRLLKNIKNRFQWKIHVFADLQPYICTSSSCADEFFTFPTRQMWADHEFHKHRVRKLWRCHLCVAHLPSSELWDDHIKEVHGTNIISYEEYQKVISVAEINQEVPIISQTCPMCLKAGMKTKKEFVTHIAKHMESISLAALPRGVDSDSGSDNISSADLPKDADSDSGSDNISSADLPKDADSHFTSDHEFFGISFDLDSRSNIEQRSNSVERGGRAKINSPSLHSLGSPKGDDEIAYEIKCICGFTDDDGSTIWCETCDTWQHIECYYYGNVKEASQDDFNHLCADCSPRLLDQHSATLRQRTRRQEGLVANKKKVNTKLQSSSNYQNVSDSDSEVKVVAGSRGTPDLPSQENSTHQPLSPALDKEQVSVSWKELDSDWTKKEQQEFPDLLEKYGCDWIAIAQSMETKSPAMVRSYYARGLASDESGSYRSVRGEDQRPSAAESNLQQSDDILPAKKQLESDNLPLDIPDTLFPDDGSWTKIDEGESPED